MKKINIIIGVITLSIVILSGVISLNYLKVDFFGTNKKISIRADYPKYDNLDNLIDRADTIVLGKILNIRYEELNISEQPKINDEFNNPGGELDETKDVYTVYNIEISETYKGNVAVTDIIEVKQLGGIIGSTEYIVENYKDSDLEISKDYILFLETYENSPASLLNPLQASYEVELNEKARNVDSQYLISSNPNNEINFTMSDLINNDKLYQSHLK